MTRYMTTEAERAAGMAPVTERPERPTSPPTPPGTEVERRWLSRKSVAERLDVHPATVGRFVDEGRLTAYSLGRSVRYDLAEVDALLETQKLSNEGASPAYRARLLEVTLAEVLQQFSVKGHPGAACLQTPWVRIATVERWRGVLRGDSV